MNKTFKVETKKGKVIFVVERQMAHDPQYKIGSRIPGSGKVVEVCADGTLDRLIVGVGA